MSSSKYLPDASEFCFQQHKSDSKECFRYFHFDLWVNLFLHFFVNNKGISGVLILLMFLWQSPSIHGQRCMKGRKDILEVFLCNLSNSFFAKKKKKKIYSIQKFLGIESMEEEIQKCCYTSLPLFHMTVSCFPRTLRNGDKV